MFGYVNVLRDELKIKEYNMFKAYYCGLCKRQGKLFGNATRLALSYDFTALALILDSITADPSPLKKTRCMLHPTQKRPVIVNSAALDYCAYMSVAMTYFKIKDDISDKTVSKYTLMLPSFAIPMKKIKKAYPDKIAGVEKLLTHLSEAEHRHSKSIDEVSAFFGHIMELLFDENGTNEALRYLGYNLGRWLYIADAIDDFNKDIKTNSYNPFSSAEDIKNSMPSLWYNLSEVSKAYELLEIKRNKGITDNIIYFGLKSATYRVLQNAETNNKGLNAPERRNS